MKSNLFKNIYPFTFTTSAVCLHVASTLETELALKPFTKRNPTQARSVGWVKPLGSTTSNYTHMVGSFILFSLKIQEAILPSKVIANKLASKVKKIEALEQRKVSNQEKKQLREDIEFELLPRAFNRDRTINAWIDTKHGFLCIDTASSPEATEFTTVLRKTLGSLPVELFDSELETPLTTSLTQWVRDGSVPSGFLLGDEVTMKSLESAKVRYTAQYLDSDEIRENLASGKYVVDVAVSLEDKVHFVFTDTFQLKKLNFGTDFENQLEDTEIDNYVDLLDADFAILTGEVTEVLKLLLSIT